MKLDLRKTQSVKGITLTPLGNSKILIYNSGTKKASIEEVVGSCPKCGENYSSNTKFCKDKNCNSQKLITQFTAADEIIEVINFDSGAAPYWVPNDEDLEKFVKGLYKENINDWKKLWEDIIHLLKLGIDTSNESDYTLLGLWILQTYFSDFLDNTLSVAVKGQSGSAKTIVLEYLQALGYRTMIADTTTAAMVVSINDYRFNLLFDEIDTIKDPQKRNEQFSIIRKSYRRGQKKMKLKKESKDNWALDFSDLFSATGMSYRELVPDDIQNRSITIKSIKSNDNTLPLISANLSYISYILKTQLFFAYVTRYSSSVKGFSAKVNKVTQVTSKKSDKRKNSDLGIKEERDRLYSEFTIGMNEEVLNYMNSLSGRNVELFKLLYDISRVTDLDLFEDLKTIFETKKQDDIINQDEYLALLRDFIRDTINDFKNNLRAANKITKGKYKDCYKMPVTDFKSGFVSYLRNKNVPVIGEGRRRKLFTDLGFTDLVNFQVIQKINDISTRCVIFDKQIKKECNLND